MIDITIPKKLAPLVQAFSADENSAKMLIIKAAQDAYSPGFENKSISNKEIEGIIALMRGINPKNTLEMIYGAQIIASHLFGIKLLSHGFKEDRILGLKLLRFSNDAMSQLQRKKMAIMAPNITLNYNHNGQRQSTQ